MSTPIDFNKLTVVQLKDYLRLRKVTFDSKNKSELVTLAQCVEKISLPVDPDFSSDTCGAVSSFQRLKDAGYSSVDPLALSEEHLSHDLSAVPRIGLYDIFNYLICSRTDYDGTQIRAYKSFEDYRLFKDGHVLDLKVANVKSNDVESNDDSHTAVTVVITDVHPTQRNVTKLNSYSYKGWLGITQSSNIIAGYCQCFGGADGACRHLAAALYELEALYERQSVTEQPAIWVRRSKPDDNPKPAKQIRLQTVRYGTELKEVCCDSENWDPRRLSDQSNNVDLVKFAEGLAKANSKAAALDFLPEVVRPKQETLEPVDASKLYLKVRACEFLEKACKMGDAKSVKCLANEFVDALVYTDTEIKLIESITSGQADNQIWKNMREGLITASNFQKCFTRSNSLRSNPDTDTSKLVTELLYHREINCASICWGKDHEINARLQYVRVEKKKHRKLNVTTSGLCIFKEKPFLGCSPDGIMTCQCKENVHPKSPSKWLLEIKCPYSCRDMCPKEAAKQYGATENDLKEWKLSEKSKYFRQIQGQLGILKISLCVLVIYTNKGIWPVEVKFDKDYFDNTVTNLEFLYREAVVPHMFKTV